MQRDKSLPPGEFLHKHGLSG